MCIHTYTYTHTQTRFGKKHKCVISGNGQEKLPNIFLHSLTTWIEKKITDLHVFQY